MRLIDADKAYKSILKYTNNQHGIGIKEALNRVPTVDAEPTEEQVEEYCRKRCLVIVTSELYDEMIAKWSAEPVRHGHWIDNETPMFGNPYGSYICSRCFPYAQAHKTSYCPNCGAKMDEVEDE